MTHDQNLAAAAREIRAYVWLNRDRMPITKLDFAADERKMAAILRRHFSQDSSRVYCDQCLGYWEYKPNMGAGNSEAVEPSGGGDDVQRDITAEEKPGPLPVCSTCGGTGLSHKRPHYFAATFLSCRDCGGSGEAQSRSTCNGEEQAQVDRVGRAIDAEFAGTISDIDNLVYAHDTITHETAEKVGLRINTAIRTLYHDRDHLKRQLEFAVKLLTDAT